MYGLKRGKEDSHDSDALITFIGNSDHEIRLHVDDRTKPDVWEQKGAR